MITLSLQMNANNHINKAFTRTLEYICEYRELNNTLQSEHNNYIHYIYLNYFNFYPIIHMHSMHTTNIFTLLQMKTKARKLLLTASRTTNRKPKEKKKNNIMKTNKELEIY